MALKGILSHAVPRQTFILLLGVMAVFSPIFAAKQQLMAYFAVWISTFLVLIRCFTAIRRDLAAMTNQFQTPEADFSSPQALPEMQLLAEAVKKMQEAYPDCKECRQRMRDIVDQCPVGIITVNEHGIIEMINQVLVNVSSERTWQECVGRSYFEILAEFNGPDKEHSAMWHALNGIETVNKPMRSKNCDWIANLKPIVRQGKIAGAIGVYQDVTQSVKATRERAAALESFASVFNSSLSIMALLNVADMTYIDVNSGWERAFGYNRCDIIGKTPEQIGFAEWQAAGRKLLAGSKNDNGEVYEISVLNRRGENKHIVLQPALIREGEQDVLLFIGVDVTKLRRYEQEIAQLDRLSLVGELAASIGHEVRNPLTTVRGFLQLFQRKEQFAAYRSQIATMIEELDRANTIISEFLSLAKDKAVDMKPVNLNDIIQALFPLMQADAYRRGHELGLKLGGIADYELDEKQIRQMLLNLVRNGLESMKKPGTIIIATELSADYLSLSVADSGCGIPDEIMSKLGNPFVTTKEHGTGLGLPVCYRVAEQHKAKIEVETGPDGTRFTILFPIRKAVAPVS